MTGIAFVIAVIALILAVVFYLQGRSAAEAVAGLKIEADAARKATDEARAQLRDRERALREELKKARGRAETNNRVYLVTKGELEIVRERLAQAEKALWKAGLPVPAPTPKERPRATGPAAADRDRAEMIEAEASERPEATPAEPPSAGAEPISAAASQPNGVEVH